MSEANGEKLGQPYGSVSGEPIRPMVVFEPSTGRVEPVPYPDNNPKTVEGAKKPPLHLIPATAKVEISAAMAEGARKYFAYNWREKSVALTVYCAAIERHCDALRDGEDRDPETGIHHAGSIGACAAIILDALATGNLIDDRPPAGKAGELHRTYSGRVSP